MGVRRNQRLFVEGQFLDLLGAEVLVEHLLSNQRAHREGIDPPLQQLLEIQLEIEKQRTEQERQRTEQERQKFNQEKEKSWRFSLQVSKQCLDEARDIAFNNWDATHGAD